MTDLLRPRSAVRWLPWSAAAFERAREEGKCVLLAVTASWSQACREMDQRCYADPGVADEINRWFVPVRVDADRRPDIADRYDLGGLPTTAFLTPEGGILGGGTLVQPGRLMSALARLHQPPAGMSTPNRRRQGFGGPPELYAAADSQTPDSNLQLPREERHAESVEQLIQMVFATFDHAHAGFGGPPKFPLVAPVRLALDLFRESGSESSAQYAARTLDAMGWGGLYDDERGGFFRCSRRADWNEPLPEKLLTTNAALLDLYLEAGVTMGNERWLARAADLLEYVQSALQGAPGEGWRASDESDGAKFSDANAQMVSAALRASRVFEDSSLRELALQSLESVLLASYRPGRGVAHCAGGVRGLLCDHVAMAAAHLDAWELTGDVPYQMMAQELAHHMIHTMWNESGGGLLDRAPGEDGSDVGLLDTLLTPFALNCEAAEMLHRLSRACDDAEFDRLAMATLDAIAGRAGSQGPLAAHYVLARRSLTR